MDYRRSALDFRIERQEAARFDHVEEATLNSGLWDHLLIFATAKYPRGPAFTGS